MPYIYQLEALRGFLGFSVLFSPCCALLPYYLLHGPGVGDIVCTHSLSRWHAVRLQNTPCSSWCWGETSILRFQSCGLHFDVTICNIGSWMFLCHLWRLMCSWYFEACNQELQVLRKTGLCSSDGPLVLEDGFLSLVSMESCIMWLTLNCTDIPCCLYHQETFSAVTGISVIISPSPPQKSACSSFTSPFS